LTTPPFGTPINPKEIFPNGIRSMPAHLLFEPGKAHLHTVELKGLKAGRDYHVVIDHPTQPDKFYFTTDINGKKIAKTVRLLS
jgi:hypothetical protein